MNKSQRPLAVGAVLTVGALVAAGITAATASATPTPPPSPAAPSALAAQKAAQLVANPPAYLMAGANDRFQQGTVVSSGAAQYVPYQRTYAGLPVRGGDFVLVTNNAGQVIFNSVAMQHPIGSVSTTPSVTQAAARALATRQLRTVSRVEGTQLVVDALGATARLAWESTVDGTDAEGPSRLTVDVDALTGKVLHTQEHVMEGTGTAAWNGPNPVTLNTTHSGSTFTLKDPTVTNLSCQDAANNTTFSGPDDAWGNGNATSRETGCVDALFGAQTEVKMLSQWLGRNGQDGNGGAWPIRVGLNQVNAFYDGTQVQVGHNNNGQWIGAIDVIAHEMGHGIDDHTPGGISRGGTQEFIADTFGASTEWFANESAPFDKPDFTVGEQVNLVGNGPIRFMYHPSLIAGHPDCFSSSIPSTEVHAAAGPGNHWFYLVAEGTNPTNGQPTSPTCNGSTVTGLGVQNAIRILYNAMLMKTSASSYLRYRVWTLQAAKNLFPGSCTEFNTVKAAWDAVSVPAQAGEPTCSGSSTLALANPGNRTGTVGTATSLSLSASGGTPPYTFSATGLPPGLTLNASTGVISGTPTTAGTFTVTATVKDSAQATASRTFTWTVNPAGGGCSSPGQKLGNPGFESGSAPWTATPAVIGAFSGQSPHSGTRLAWLDGYGTTHTDTLSQSVTLPAGCASYTLTFWLHIDTAETTTTAQNDKLTVKVGATTIATFSNLDKASGYSQKSFNLAAFAGQTVTLQFTGTENGSRQTSFVIDDTALNVS